MALKKLHDKLAIKAEASGKTAEQFNEAAQKHASAAWFLLIMAAVVWYFLGFVWALMSFSSTSIAKILEMSDGPHL
jgi:uncharacterized membrane protein YgcG